MIEVIRDAERRSLNVVRLSELLEGTDISRKPQRSKRSIRDRSGARYHQHRCETTQAPMIRIEYRYPGDQDRWNCFGTTTRLGWAQELLEVCRLNHPGSECRIQHEEAVPWNLIGVF